MANNSNIINIIIGIAVIVLVAILILGIRAGWLEGMLNIQFPNGVTPLDIDKTPTSPSCTFTFNKNTACTGEDVTATIKDGELKRCIVAYNYEDEGWRIYNVENLDINGRVSATQSADTPGTYVFTALCGYFVGERFFAECRTNDATIEIVDCEEPPDEPSVGDPIGDGNVGSGSANFGDDIITDNINIPWTPGGPYILGVRIWRTWSYINPSDTTCQLPEQYPVEWSLYDSNGMAWQAYDYVPVNNAYDEVCPVTYHPDAPWKFVVSSGISCPINYNWRIQPFICEEV